MKYNRFTAKLTNNNHQITIPGSVLKLFCLDNNLRDTELAGSILELKIIAIHINNRRIVLSMDNYNSKEKPKQE